MQGLRRGTILAGLVVLAILISSGTALGNPITPGAAATDQLFYLVLFLALIIGVVVEGLLIVAVIRFRRREGFHLPTRVKTHDTRLEFIWTALPVVVIMVVAGASFSTLQVTDTIPEGGITVDVVAQRFSWSFVYPDGSRSDGRLRVEVNQVVRINVTALDVIHSYNIPEFGLKIDAIPGRVNVYWFQAQKVGEYVIQCAEYCGVGHYAMVATLEVFGEGTQPLPYGPAPPSG